jgi:hypothetical protein
MPTAYKVLGQTTPTANTITTSYTVPASTNTIISTITVCNQGSGTAGVGIAICPANTTVTTSQYIVKNASISTSDTVFLTVGVTLNATDTVRVESNIANISFNIFGSEIS